MAWTIPDKGEGDNDIQSILFQEYLGVLTDAIDGLNCVLSGLVVTGGADMTPAVAKGGVLSNGTMFAVAAADVTITAADATNPRIDLIVVTSAGALAVRAGTAAAAPKPPTRTANDVVIAAVYVPANDTAIATSQITDMRVLVPHSPHCLLVDTATKTLNTSTAQTSIFTTAPVIPNGLFLTGRMLRVRAFGNLLRNAGTVPTLTVAITYGGTTIFQDVTAALTLTSVRQPWVLDFTISAQANNNQRMGGTFILEAAVTVPNTGTGDIGADESLANSAIGSATVGIAVDSDAANRTLDVLFTFNESNVLIEWVCQGILVELI